MPINIVRHCNISTLKMEAVVSTNPSVTTPEITLCQHQSCFCTND